MMRSERLVFTLKRQLVPGEQANVPSGQQPWSPPWPSQAATVPMDNNIVYLGETCVFDITLSNQGAHVLALTIKVECSVEGGSTSCLYDNTQSPLQQLPFNAQEQLRVQTDIKEQGLITIVASAVFTDQSGERKYHVQFFKFTSASPVSVRTRVRHLPHIITADSSSSSSTGCGVGKTRCFLEVNVQNSTQLVMQLHAVRLLAASGVFAQQIAALSNPPQQQQQPLHMRPQQLPAHSHQHPDQQQQLPGFKASSGQGQLAPAGAIGLNGSSDTELLQDIDSFASSSTGTAAPSVQQKPQQVLLQGQQQQQPQAHQQGQFWPLSGPEGQQQQAAVVSQAVPLPAGCSHNSLWQIDHHLLSAGSSGAAGSTTAGAAETSNGSSSSSSSTLGRLELHWSTCDGRTGRLLTQPLTGPVPASGKEVLMQLHCVSPRAPHTGPGAAAVLPHSAMQAQQLTTSLAVNEPFTATFTLTAGSHDMGPLLVLYTTMPPPGNTGSSSSSGLSSSSSLQLATDSSSLQAHRLGGNVGDAGASASDSSCPEVVVQGSRSRRVPGLPAGQSVDVAFELLPLRCGWLRLPTFVVASEADGRLLDGVHDVHVLVV